jgi:hypothetical protein
MMKRHILTLIAAIIMMAIATSCGGRKHFNVEGTLEGMGSQPVFAFYLADNRVAVDTVEVIKDKFKLVGYSETPTVVELYTRGGGLIGRFIACPGDEFKMGVPQGGAERIVFKESLSNSELMTFLEEHPAAERNKAIAKYVKANPTNIVAAALLRYYYDPSDDPETAARLAAMISDDNHPIVADMQALLSPYQRKQAIGSYRLVIPDDSLVTFRPARRGLTLICFDNTISLTDTITDTVVRRYKRLIDAKLTVAHIRMRPDTTNWWRMRKRYPSGVDFYWAAEAEAGGDLRRVGIDSYPLFVLTDSTGKQLQRVHDIFEIKISD